MVNQWREVCRWDVEDGHVSERGGQDTERGDMASDEPTDWQAIANEWCNAAWRNERNHLLYWAAFNNMAACYEELAGEHEELRAEYNSLVDALNSPRGVVCSMPLADDGKVSVRPYVRAKPRRSRTAPEARAEDSPTGDKDIESGESQAKASDEPGVLMHICYPDESCGQDLIRQGLEDCAEGRVSPVDLGEERSE